MILLGSAVVILAKQAAYGTMTTTRPYRWPDLGVLAEIHLEVLCDDCQLKDRP